MLVDTHAHLDDPGFDADRSEVMRRAAAVGVTGVVVPGVAREGWSRLRALAAEHGWAFAVGTHPHALPDGLHVPTSVEDAVAVGECGLDGGVPVEMDVQERVLRAHLALARDAGLPVILHCWRAHHRLPALLAAFAPVRGVLHSYSGGPDLVATYCALGLHLSFGGAITRPSARRPVEALRRVPLDRLLLETDAPDQPPSDRSPAREGGEPVGRGVRNEPCRLPEVLAAAERIRGAALTSVLHENVLRLGLWPPRGCDPHFAPTGP